MLSSVVKSNLLSNNNPTNPSSPVKETSDNNNNGNLLWNLPSFWSFCLHFLRSFLLWIISFLSILFHPSYILWIASIGDNEDELESRRGHSDIPAPLRQYIENSSLADPHSEVINCIIYNNRFTVLSNSYHFHLYLFESTLALFEDELFPCLGSFIRCSLCE